MAFDFSEIRQNFASVLALVKEDLKLIKTGRAKPALVEDIQVEAYSSLMPLKELASISAPDAHMILIQPWDQSVIEGIEKALQKAGFNPNADGQQLRLNIPPLTGEKRQQMIKQVAQHIESGKQMLRNERNEAKRKIEAQKGSAGISEDDIKNDEEELDQIIKDYNQQLDDLGEAKKTELETI